MKIVGITRIRNEAKIIGHTLNHLQGFVDAVYVFDDCSTDDSVKICENHPLVVSVIKNTNWISDPNIRLQLEGSQRQHLYEHCLSSNPDWVYYFDADEFIEFDKSLLTTTIHDSFKLRFFDYYITDADKDKEFFDREYCGCEYREILTLFKARNDIHFSHREPTLQGTNCGFYGKVKHYGKAISIEEWESTCDYYINHLYEDLGNGQTIAERWKERKGKAIHTKSDFGTDLIKWSDTDSLLIKNI